MQLELRQLNRQLGLTFIYVTHDQEEALTMSDRIALMRNGRIEQLSSPHEMYDRPVTRYVADFIGESNLLRAAVREVEGSEVVLGIGPATVKATSARPWTAGAEAWLAVRPEYLRPAAPGEGPNRLEGTARESVFTGSITRQYVTMADGASVVFHLPAGTTPPAAGSPLTLTWPVERGICVGD